MMMQQKYSEQRGHQEEDEKVDQPSLEQKFQHFKTNLPHLKEMREKARLEWRKLKEKMREYDLIDSAKLKEKMLELKEEMLELKEEMLEYDLIEGAVMSLDAFKAAHGQEPKKHMIEALKERFAKNRQEMLSLGEKLARNKMARRSPKMLVKDLPNLHRTISTDTLFLKDLNITILVDSLLLREFTQILIEAENLVRFAEFSPEGRAQIMRQLLKKGLNEELQEHQQVDFRQRAKERAKEYKDGNLKTKGNMRKEATEEQSRLKQFEPQSPVTLSALEHQEKLLLKYAQLDQEQMAEYRKSDPAQRAKTREIVLAEINGLQPLNPQDRNAWERQESNNRIIRSSDDLFKQFGAIDTEETLELLTIDDKHLTTPLVKKVRAAFKESLRVLHIEAINGSLMDTRDNEQRQASPYTELTDRLTLTHFEALAKKINGIDMDREKSEQQKDESLKETITNFAKEFPRDMSPAARTCIGLLLGAVLGAAAALAVVAFITGVNPGIIDFTETITAITGGAGAGGVFAGSVGFFGRRISQEGAGVLENFASSIAPNKSPRAADNAGADDPAAHLSA